MLFRKFKKALSIFRNYGTKYLVIQTLNSSLFFFDRLKSFGLRLLLYPFRKIKRALPDRIIARLPLPKAIKAYINPPLTGVRRYIDPEIGIEAFFDALNEKWIRYVILRWFEDLPDWPPNEDIDLLLEDEDIVKIKELFVQSPQTIPCDIFSVSAVSSYNGLPYYPPHIAEIMLQNRVIFKNRYYIPNPEHHFLSLAYHVVFHKAERAGLPLSEHKDNPVKSSDHPYADILTELGKRVNIRFKPTLEAMHFLLEKKKWIPQLDTLRKLSEKSEWLASLLPPSRFDALDGEMLVFVVREWAVNNKLEFIIDFLKKHESFEILKVIKLNKNQQESASLQIRGGEWGRGPYPVNGGKPGVMIVVYDSHPIPVPDAIKAQYPYINNGNVVAKYQIRDEINNSMLQTRWVNCVHSSDDEIEAWEYLKAISSPEIIQEVREELQKHRKYC